MKLLVAGFLLSLTFVTQAAAYKILMFPLGNRSHLIEFHGLGRVLLNRGHEVHIYLSKVDTAPSEIAKAGYKFVHPNFDDTLSHVFFDEELAIHGLQSRYEKMKASMQSTNVFKKKLKHMARITLEDHETMTRIKNERYDFMVIDNLFYSYYLFLIPYQLGVPYGGLTTIHEALTNRVPLLPSAFIDAGFSSTLGTDYTELGNSLLERIKNTLSIAFHENFIYGWTDEIFAERNVTFNQVLRNVAVHIVDQTYLLSDPIPTTPHAQVFGGLATRPPSPITDASILQFVQHAQRVVVVSFGTYTSSLTPAVIDKLMQSFRMAAQYKFKFVMRLRLKGRKVHNKPDNVLLLDWLPQNDLLAHNNTVLFITHSGNNGQNEALYHAMPMVAFYIFSDQEHNADRVVRRGYAVKLNLLTFTEGELVDAINEVATNQSYKRKISAASEIFRSTNPGEKAAELIEHVIEFGSDHLRPTEAFDLSLAEFLLLDVVFSFFILLTVLFALLAIALRKVFRKVASSFG